MKNESNLNILAESTKSKKTVLIHTEPYEISLAKYYRNLEKILKNYTNSIPNFTSYKASVSKVGFKINTS
ncbi:hypothetical protein, partial [Vibrio vulnificus]|uniref:hypothetical protein n=1 Tax=Vibrio vulnificus TaxID=672 RepID=UPI0019D47F8F